VHKGSAVLLEVHGRILQTGFASK